MIKILFFAHIQDAIGKESITIEDDSLTIKDLKEKLANQYHLKHLQNIMFAINEEYADDHDVICQGDIVALIPPVSGG